VNYLGVSVHYSSLHNRDKINDGPVDDVANVSHRADAPVDSSKFAITCDCKANGLSKLIPRLNELSEFKLHLI